jgi:hypothetical protein
MVAAKPRTLVAAALVRMPFAATTLRLTINKQRYPMHSQEQVLTSHVWSPQQHAQKHQSQSRFLR